MFRSGIRFAIETLTGKFNERLLTMTVRLVKQNQQSVVEEKPIAQPSKNQLIVTTQGWVEEFKARKAKGESLGILSRNN